MKTKASDKKFSNNDSLLVYNKYLSIKLKLKARGQIIMRKRVNQSIQGSSEQLRGDKKTGSH